MLTYLPRPDKRCALAVLIMLAWPAGVSSLGAEEGTADRLRRSIVKIEVQGKAYEFKNGVLVPRKFDAVGSGVVAGDGNIVLTAGHVLAQMDSSINITDSEGHSVRARPIAVDRDMDVAILELEEPLENVVSARVSEDPPVAGMDLWVMGHPLGLEFSLTKGIVSAVRKFEEFGVYAWNGHIIQLDAALNQGVSGGGVFDQKGRLVGVAASIVTRSGGFEGIGFAVGVDAIQEMIDASPCVFLGVDAAPLPKELGQLIGVSADGTFLVQQVFPGGLADRVGLRGGTAPVLFGGSPAVLSGGDIILEINGLAECREACRLMSSRSADGTAKPHEISLTIWRNGSRQELSVAIHDTPHRAAFDLLGDDRSNRK